MWSLIILFWTSPRFKQKAVLFQFFTLFGAGSLTRPKGLFVAVIPLLLPKIWQIKQKSFISDLYRELFPFVGVVSEGQNKTWKRVLANVIPFPQVHAVTGVHASQIIIDDPLNALQATSEAERQTANKWITETLSSAENGQKSYPDNNRNAKDYEKMTRQDIYCQKPENKKNMPTRRVIGRCLPWKPERFYIDGLMDIKGWTRTYWIMQRRI